MTKATDKVWAWMRRNKAPDDFIVRSAPGDTGEAIFGAADGEIDAWLFVAEADNTGQPVFVGANAAPGLYVAIRKNTAREFRVSVKAVDTITTKHGVVIYEGPLAITDEALLEHWSRLIADKLKQEN